MPGKDNDTKKVATRRQELRNLVSSSNSYDVEPGVGYATTACKLMKRNMRKIPPFKKRKPFEQRPFLNRKRAVLAGSLSREELSNYVSEIHTPAQTNKRSLAHLWTMPMMRSPLTLYDSTPAEHAPTFTERPRASTSESKGQASSSTDTPDTTHEAALALLALASSGTTFSIQSISLENSTAEDDDDDDDESEYVLFSGQEEQAVHSYQNGGQQVTWASSGSESLPRTLPSAIRRRLSYSTYFTSPK